MTSSLLYAVGFAVLMAGLLVEVAIFRAVYDDQSCTSQLSSVCDKLIRLVVDGKVDRDEPHFEALYRNVNSLLSVCHQLSGLDGWKLAKADARPRAHHSGDGVTLAPLPPNEIPSALAPIVDELRVALEHIVARRSGLHLLMNGRVRELSKLQKARARALLEIVASTA